MIDKKELEEEILMGRSNKELAVIFKCSAETIRNYIKKYNLQRKVLHKWDIEKLRELSLSCGSKREILLSMEFRDNGENYTFLNRIAKENNITLPSKQRHSGNVFIENENFFVDNSNRKGYDIKKRLLKLGHKEECDICGIGNVWNNLPLVHQIDHINGKHTDNRFENLRLLCPNCHSQQETSYKRKSKVLN